MSHQMVPGSSQKYYCDYLFLRRIVEISSFAWLTLLSSPIPNNIVNNIVYILSGFFLYIDFFKDKNGVILFCNLLFFSKAIMMHIFLTLINSPTTWFS